MLQLLVFVAVDPTGLVALLMEVGAVSTMLNYALHLPTSRGHEAEADALGLQVCVAIPLMSSSYALPSH